MQSANLHPVYMCMRYVPTEVWDDDSLAASLAASILSPLPPKKEVAENTVAAPRPVATPARAGPERAHTGNPKQTDVPKQAKTSAPQAANAPSEAHTRNPDQTNVLKQAKTGAPEAANIPSEALECADVEGSNEACHVDAYMMISSDGFMVEPLEAYSVVGPMQPDSEEDPETATKKRRTREPTRQDLCAYMVSRCLRVCLICPYTHVLCMHLTRRS